MEGEDTSTNTSRTRRTKWTSLRPRPQMENRRTSTSGNTPHAPRTGPLPAAAALGTGTIGRRRGAAVPTAMRRWTPVSTHDTTIATPRPPPLPYPYSGDQHDPCVAMAHNPYAPRPGAPQPTHTGTIRTLGVTRGTASPGTSTAQ